VGRIVSEVRVSASFQMIRLMGRLELEVLVSVSLSHFIYQNTILTRKDLD